MSLFKTHKHLGALALALTVVLPANAQERPAGLLRFPDIHGDTVVFAQGDQLWRSSISGGAAIRISAIGTKLHNLRISPDGKSIAYSATIDTNVDIFVVPIDGSSDAVRITHHPAADQLVDWTPDGHGLIFASTMLSPRATYNQLFIVPASGGLPEKLPLPYGETAAYSADGKRLIFTYLRDFQEEAWKRYFGGRAPDLWALDFATGTTTRLTMHDASDSFPMVVGDNIFFLSERGENGRANLWRIAEAGGEASAATNFDNSDVRHPATDGRRIVFEADGRLYVYDPADTESREVTVGFEATDPDGEIPDISVSDRIVSARLGIDHNILIEARGEVFRTNSRNGKSENLTATPGAAERFPAANFRGDVAFISDRDGEYDLYVQMAGEQHAQKVAEFGAGLRYRPHWSPDGNRIALFDHENVLWLVDLRDGAKRRVDQGLWWYHSDLVNLPVSWSPDGRWLAYSRGLENRNNAIFLYDTHDGKLHQLTSGAFDDYEAQFDSTGNYLLTLSNRHFEPTYGDVPVDATWTYRDASVVGLIPLRSGYPMPGSDVGGVPHSSQEAKIDFEQAEDRLRVLSPKPGSLSTIHSVPGGFVILRRGEEANRLERYEFGKDELQLLQEMPQLALEDIEGDRILTRAGTDLYVISATKGKAKPVKLGELSMPFDRIAESQQMFADAWRFSRDFYYDSGLHGADWDAVRRQYEPLVKQVATDDDLTFVIREMLGELNGGHVYASAEPPSPRGDARNVGLLGVDFERDGTRFRISRIYRTGSRAFDVHSPLDETSPGVREGDYLLAVNGKSLAEYSDPWEAFAGLVDKDIQLTVAPFDDPTSSREISVRALSSERKLRELAWVEANRRKVEQASGGRIGYIYVPNTGTEGVNELMIQYRSQFNKDALIIDERFNTGGALGDRLVELLNRPPLVMFRARNSRDYALPELANRGPKAMLINGWSYSGGDGFPLLFKTAKLGPLIGERTWGGLIGPGMRMELINGGFVSPAPQRVYTVEGEWAEGNEGVRPNIRVTNNPGELAKGIDQQLSAAVDYLMDEISALRPMPVPNFQGPEEWNPANRGDSE